MNTNSNPPAPSTAERINHLEEQIADTRQQIAATRSALQAQSEQIAEVLKALSRLAPTHPPGDAAGSTTHPPLPEPVGSFVTRRSMLKKAALATLGASAVLETMPAARATSPTDVVLGGSNSAITTTTITTSSVNALAGVSGSASGVYGMSSSGTGVEGVSTTGSGVYGNSSSSGSPGVMGNTTSQNTGGVYGTGPYAGVYGASGDDTTLTPGTGVGLLGLADGYGALLSGALAPLYLQVNTRNVSNPNDDGDIDHNVGEFFIDSVGGLWYCVVPGAPGTWNRLATTVPAQSTNAGSFTLLPGPTRFIDTRTSAESPTSTPGVSAPAPGSHSTPYIFTGTGALTPYTPSGSTAPVIPFGATAVFGRVTVLSGENGHTATKGTLQCSNLSPPGFGSGLISWTSTPAIQATPFILPLNNSSGTSGKVYFLNTSGTDHIDILVDLIGYYI